MSFVKLEKFILVAILSAIDVKCSFILDEISGLFTNISLLYLNSSIDEDLSLVFHIASLNVPHVFLKSLLQLFNLKENYTLLNLSTTEVNIQIYKLFTWPIYLALMTILASMIMFNTKRFKSNTLKISIGLFFSVLIYYINNFTFLLNTIFRL